MAARLRTASLNDIKLDRAMLLLFITAEAGTAYIGACILRRVKFVNVSAVEIAFDPLIE